MITRYRVIYKDGTHGTWTLNKAEAEENLKFFNGIRIETWTAELP